MMRTGAPRALLQPLTSRISVGCARNHFSTGIKSQSPILKSANKSFALTAFRQHPTAVARRYASAAAIPGTYRDPEREKKISERIMVAHPDRVFGDSTTTQPKKFALAKPEEEVDMMAGIRSDWSVIKDTFGFSRVPREVIQIGLAGVLPYLATSTATVICAFDYNNAVQNGGQGLLLSDSTAYYLLNVLEPIQVGYGAVILSFLGAIHWGLEWAGYGGKHGYPRYAIGVLAPAVAWPTLLFPVEHALITQFLAFNVLYAVDSAACNRGWTPSWYSSYRFILTFVVGVSIVLSLIGRGQVAERGHPMPTAAERARKQSEETLGGIGTSSSGK